MADTIVAISTGLQNSAIGVIRLSGDEAVLLAEKAMKRKLQDRVATYGVLKNDRGDTLDQCVVTVFAAPHSYTGENMAEFSCHGGLTVLSGVMEYLCTLGARPAERGEFTKRAFLNGKMDLSQSEAVIDVIMAKSPLSVKEAFLQVSGHLKRKINDYVNRLTDLDARIMAYVDFSAEGIDAPDGVSLAQEILPLLEELKKLSATYAVGRQIKEGVSVAITGKPNVGKSSLMNALLQKERSIVTSVAGTTRDVVEDTTVLDGLCVRLSDTAGVHETEDAVESIGVEKTKETVRDSSVILCLFDGSRPLDGDDEALLALAKEQNALTVINKCDLPQQFSLPNAVSVSCETGEGLSELTKALKEKALGSAATESDLLITSLRHHGALEKAISALENAVSTLQTGVDPEICELDIASALGFLGEITGDSVRDDMIDRIFENFCVGK